MRHLLCVVLIFASVCFGQVASDNMVVVGNQTQPVQWEHRNSIQEAIAKAGPNGTVWIPANYQGKDCNPISTCNPDSTVIIDLRGGRFQTTPAAGLAPPVTLGGQITFVPPGQPFIGFTPDPFGAYLVPFGQDQLSDVNGALMWNPFGPGVLPWQLVMTCSSIGAALGQFPAYNPATGCFQLTSGAPVINVKDFPYGLKTDGSDNLLAAKILVLALNQMTTGATVFFPAGTYNFSDNWDFLTTNNIKLIGAGQGDTILNRTGFVHNCTAGQNCGLIGIKGRNLEVANMTIQGAGSFTGPFDTRGKGIYGPPSNQGGLETGIYIHNVELAGLEAEAFYCNVCSQLSYIKNYVHNNAGDGFNPADFTAVGCLADGNTFLQNEGGAMQPTCGELTIVNNFMRNVWGASGNAALAYMAAPTHFIFSNNILDGSVAPNGTSSLLAVQSASVPVYGVISDNIFRNNKILTTSGTGNGAICIGCAAPTMTGMIHVAGNTFMDNWNAVSLDTYGIEIDGSANTTNIVIEGNAFAKGTAPSSTITAIRTGPTLSASNNVIIGVNTFYSDLDAQYSLAVAPLKAIFPNNGTCTAAAAATCTTTFPTNLYKVAPFCQATEQTNIVALKAAPTTSNLVISTAGVSSDTFAYNCSN